MNYNIIYKTYRDIGVRYILLLDDAQIEKFSKDFRQGENSFYHSGVTHTIQGTHEILVYDTSKIPSLNIDALKKHLYLLGSQIKFPSLEQYGKELSEYGVNVTTKFISDSWGKGKIRVQDTAEVTIKIYIEYSRIDELKQNKSSQFDLTKLIKLCEELNSSHQEENWFAVGALVRAVMDHIPPIFGYINFDEIANNYKADGDAQSFKKSMLNLAGSMKNISDSFLHSQIRKSEVLPNEISVDCKKDLDKLLGEVIRILKTPIVAISNRDQNNSISNKGGHEKFDKKNKSTKGLPKMEDYFSGIWQSTFTFPNGSKAKVNIIEVKNGNEWWENHKHKFNVEDFRIEGDKMTFKKIEVANPENILLNILNIHKSLTMFFGTENTKTKITYQKIA